MQKPIFDRLLKLDSCWVRERIQTFLAEDMPTGDATTLATVPAENRAIGYVIAEEPLVFAGTEILPHCFPESCQVDIHVPDGQKVVPDTVLATISGSARDLLSHERVMLNLLQRLCGIATETRRYTELPLPADFMVLDTRKTTPGLRLFEKYAVAVGGGYNHRLNLSTAILIKDNHLQAAGGVAMALEKLHIDRKNQTTCPWIELEVDTLAQLQEGLALGIQAFLLDNMTPQQVIEAVQLVRKRPDGNRIFLEASGGMTYDTISAYAHTGINGISIGALTTRACNVNIKLEFKEQS